MFCSIQVWCFVYHCVGFGLQPFLMWWILDKLREGGVPEKEVLRFTEGEGTNVWTRVMNSVWICMSVDMCVCVHACDVACES